MFLISLQRDQEQSKCLLFTIQDHSRNPPFLICSCMLLGNEGYNKQCSFARSLMSASEVEARIPHDVGKEEEEEDETGGSGLILGE